MEAIYEVTYVEDFIEAVDNADDLARQKTQLLEMHCEQIKLLERIESEMSKLLGDEKENELGLGIIGSEKKEVLKHMEDMLIQVAQVSDKGRRICDDFETIIESKLRTLNNDLNILMNNFYFCDNEEGCEENSSSSDSEQPENVSPEPTYCLCEKISRGKMVQCDNDLCPIEWFHFGCVNLKKTPKSEWYCPRCRGESSAVMKPKSEFLKELEQYNKQKEMEYEIKK